MLQRYLTSPIAIAVTLVSAKVLLHVAIINEYGYHRDELYLIECGRNLAWALRAVAGRGRGWRYHRRRKRRADGMSANIA